MSREHLCSPPPWLPMPRDSQLSGSLGLDGGMCCLSGLEELALEALGWPLLLQGMLWTVLVTWGWTQL